MNAAARAAFEAALWSSVLIGALLGVRRAAAGRLEPECFRCAWALLAARMALPCSFAFSFAPMRAELPVQAEAVAGEVRYRLVLSGQAATAHGAQEAAGGAWDITALVRVLPWVWLAGCCCFLLWHFGSYAVWMHRIRGKAALEHSEEILGRTASAFGRRVTVWRMQESCSPMLAGLVRPALYLPQDLPEQDLPYILAHEAQHLRRHDLLLQLLLCVAGAVQWFNPLAYVMRRAAQCDLELACDAAALRGRRLPYRRAYGTAVLHVLSCARREAVLSTGFAGTSASLKARFQEMLRETKKKKGLWLPVLFAAAICTASLFVGCGTIAAAPAPLSGAAAEGEKPQSTAAVTVPDVVGMTRWQAEDALVQAGLKSGGAEGSALTADAEEQTVVVRQTPQAGEKAQSGSTVALFWSSDDSAAVLPQESASLATALSWPVPGYTEVSKPFGGSHRGADIPAPQGTPVCAAQGGTVEAAELHSSFGNYVEILCEDGSRWIYAHCDTLSVEAGAVVQAGDPIATVGHTGNTTEDELHLELKQNDALTDPIVLFETARQEG